ncbi:MAG: hypothetical protein P8M72_05425 [Gammaproteobacteria bacterium]|nr:hypothetical protein [Gammaproteobacteria bacterium]
MNNKTELSMEEQAKKQSGLLPEEEAEKSFLNNISEELDRSCDGLDGHTQSRLNSIRHSALEHGRKSPGRTLLAPFGGLVTACVLVLVVGMLYQGQPQTPSQAVPDSISPMEDLDILTSAESLELFENLEFYQWLEENEISV